MNRGKFNGEEDNYEDRGFGGSEIGKEEGGASEEGERRQMKFNAGSHPNLSHILTLKLSG